MRSLDLREPLPFVLESDHPNQAALHMLHCRIDTATLSPSFHALESRRSRKFAFVPGLEWL
jgi:hypothetical protein